MKCSCRRPASAWVSYHGADGKPVVINLKRGDQQPIGTREFAIHLVGDGAATVEATVGTDGASVSLREIADAAMAGG